MLTNFKCLNCGCTEGIEILEYIKCQRCGFKNRLKHFNRGARSGQNANSETDPKYTTGIIISGDQTEN